MRHAARLATTSFGNILVIMGRVAQCVGRVAGISMTTPQPKSHRLQFSLRKLLLWTAVVAVYCGLGKLAAESEARVLQGYDDTSFVAAITVMAVVSVGLKAVSPPLTAWHISVLAGGLVVEAWGWIEYDGDDVLGAFLFGAGMGWTVFLVVEGTCRFVNWADNFVEKKTASRE